MLQTENRYENNDVAYDLDTSIDEDDYVIKSVIPQANPLYNAIPIVNCPSDIVLPEDVAEGFTLFVNNNRSTLHEFPKQFW